MAWVFDTCIERIVLGLFECLSGIVVEVKPFLVLLISLAIEFDLLFPSFQLGILLVATAKTAHVVESYLGSSGNPFECLCLHFQLLVFLGVGSITLLLGVVLGIAVTEF